MVETGSARLAMLKDFGEDMSASSERTGFFRFRGIFDNDHEMVAGQTMDFSLQRPRITCISRDIAGLLEGDNVTIRGELYQVVVIMPDGTGFTELMLEQQ